MSESYAPPFELRPLDGHTVLDSDDPHEAASVFERVLHKGRVMPGTSDRRFRARMEHRGFGGFSLNRLAVGSPGTVDAGTMRTFYIVHTPLAGRAQITSRRQTVRLARGDGAVYTTRANSLLELEAGCDRLMVKLQREVVDRVAAAFTGVPRDRPVEFATAMPGDGPAFARWWGLVAHMLAELRRDPGAFDGPLVRAGLEQMLAATLLQYQPNDLNGQGAAAALPRRVRRAMDWLDAHAHEPVELADLAAASGCGLSALYAGFREHVGRTPMAYLRDVRLARVHAELRAADPRTCQVTDVATRWGFFHFGRFAAAYRERFGELPRETLRR